MFRVPQMRPMRRSRGIVLTKVTLIQPFETPPLTPGSEDFDRCGLLCVVEATWLNRSVALLGFDAAAFIFQILSATCSAHGQNVELCSHNFLARHATIWPANTPRFWSAYWSGTTFLEYHMQSFITGFENPHPGDNLKNNPFGIRCEREDASLSLLGKKLFSVTERRYSHSVTISPYGSHYGNFAIVTLVDSDPERVDSLKYAEKKGVYDVEHCPRLSGLVVFQHQLCTSMDSWEDDWTRMLLQIDAVLTVKVNDILDPDSRERHMYDDEKLQQSALYFSLLQLLRIFSESIERNVSDLENLVGKSQTNLKERAVWYYQRSDEINREIATITQNWDVVLYRHKKAADALLARILRKTDDIKSLQDGVSWLSDSRPKVVASSQDLTRNQLFSALSVKEAIKSTDINHYLLIFTVVTILYLPPAFVATFYGMHLFDTGDEIGSTQRQFWTVFASVSGVTYLIAVVALLGVDQRRKLRGWITNWYRGPTASQDSDDAGIKRKSNASPRGHAPHEGSFSSMFCRQTGADEDVEAAKGPDKGKEKKTT
ncbi:unnamed protein product [Periconia digitata]|uniref:Uncharacterized protein n=1 Tax=Periconia digitata TaxID=1303443 RepID=A0A9W4XTG7_9PLEO|nr:unnamed protein product [Periconia digitata]